MTVYKLEDVAEICDVQKHVVLDWVENEGLYAYKYPTGNFWVTPKDSLKRFLKENGKRLGIVK
jgi:hypothetical protein